MRSSSDLPLGTFAPWQLRLGVASGCTVPGVLVRLTGGVAPPPMQVVAYGAAVVAAAFMLAWATEAAQTQLGSGLVIALVAFVAVLPEYVVEVHYAITGQAAYVTANLTGASRLLLGFAIGLPAAITALPRRWRPADPARLELAPSHRLELAILGLTAVWSLRAVLHGRLTILDSAFLLSLYVLYLRRVTAMNDDGPEAVGVAAELAALPQQTRTRVLTGVMLFAALVILGTAVPFGDAVLATGASVGISPYLLLQWIVPIATEAPELVVAAVLLLHGRGGQSLAVLLAGAVSQYTLALGTLPLAFHLGSGVGPILLPGRERVELFLSTGVALYAVASLVMLRLSRGDSAMMLILFSAQFLLPGVLPRLGFGLVLWVVAVDILVSERRHVPLLLRALRPASAATRRARLPRSPRGHRRRPSPAAAGARHRRPR